MYVSALTGEGIESLRAQILEAISPEGGVAQEDGFITSLRHEQLLKESAAYLEKAKAAAKLAEESAAKAKAAATEAENQRAIAQAQRDKADQLTKQATERADRLQTQLGSKSIEDLK